MKKWPIRQMISCKVKIYGCVDEAAAAYGAVDARCAHWPALPFPCRAGHFAGKTTGRSAATPFVRDSSVRSAWDGPGMLIPSAPDGLRQSIGRFNGR
ncbi:MAG TPA: hypothetical protein VFC78_04620 [Tepidisphaeraceae bacterium]|nr:hypothetical protein [Tepidisphaeraceae bacterium]